MTDKPSTTPKSTKSSAAAKPAAEARGGPEGRFGFESDGQARGSEVPDLSRAAAAKPAAAKASGAAKSAAKPAPTAKAAPKTAMAPKPEAKPAAKAKVTAKTTAAADAAAKASAAPMPAAKPTAAPRAAAKPAVPQRRQPKPSPRSLQPRRSRAAEPVSATPSAPSKLSLELELSEVKTLTKMGKSKGNLTDEEIQGALSDIDLTDDQFDSIYTHFRESGIEVVTTRRW